jgi:hypothetical protein
MKKISLLIFALVFGATLAQAQYSSNIQLGQLNTFGTPKSIHGFGGGGGIIRAFENPKFTIGFSANLYFGGKVNTFDTIRALTGNDPTLIPIAVNRKVFAFSGELGIRYYLKGDVEEDANIYMLAGLGSVRMTVKVKSVEEFDRSVYGYQGDAHEVGSFIGLDAYTANIGLGFEKALNYNFLFGNVRYHHNFITDANSNVDVTVKGAVTLEFGIRIPVN